MKKKRKKKKKLPLPIINCLVLETSRKREKRKEKVIALRFQFATWKLDKQLARKIFSFVDQFPIASWNSNFPLFVCQKGKEKREEKTEDRKKEETWEVAVSFREPDTD